MLDDWRADGETMVETLEQPLAPLLDSHVRNFLMFARIGRLATADRNAKPHNVPVCFCFDGLRFYFVVDEKPKRQGSLGLKRMRNIAENPSVALIVDHYEEDWDHLAYVLAMRRLRDKYAQYRAMALSPERNPMVRIEPQRVHVWGQRFSQPSGSQT